MFAAEITFLVLAVAGMALTFVGFTRIFIRVSTWLDDTRSGDGTTGFLQWYFMRPLAATLHWELAALILGPLSLLMLKAMATD